MLVRFKTIPDFGGVFQGYLPLITLFGGIATSFIAFAFVISITTSRARAIDLAERMTRSQRRIVDSSRDIIAVLDMNGVWRTVNRASIGVLEFDPDVLLGQNIFDRIANAEDIETIKEKWTAAEDEKGFMFDVQMRAQSGEVRWVSWNFTVSRGDGFIYSIGRDVTLQKTAEEQIKLRNKQVQLAEQFALEASEFKSRFMRLLSHNLRNGLTGSLGFLQLLSHKLYDNEDESDAFLEAAEQSTEQLFSAVTDIIDVAGEGENDGDVKTNTTVWLPDIMTDIHKKIGELLPEGRTVEIELTEDSQRVGIIGEKDLVVSCLAETLAALSGGEKKMKMMMTTRPNPYEKVAEVEILSPADKDVEELLEVYKKSSGALVESLPHDRHDILFMLGLAASHNRTLNGGFIVDNLGAGDENVAQITFPLAKSA